jgi:hypothetical protein
MLTVKPVERVSQRGQRGGIEPLHVIDGDAEGRVGSELSQRP